MKVGDTDFNKIIESQYLNNQADAYFHLSQDKVQGLYEIRIACPSSKHLGLLSLLFSGGFGSSWFNVKPLVVGGSSGVSG